mmetsp:Transcript_70515/g.228370  ORF Transcript_70515/g.228370 Transcript_70515/m.228370 type:complete len:217 (-) Transcript_70515:312-962(-)
MCMLSMRPSCSRCSSSPPSRWPSQFASRLWKAAWSEMAKSSCDAGSMAATNSDHSIWPSLSKSEACAARAAAPAGTPRPRRKPASSCCLTQPSASPSMATKRLSRCPSSEAGSCVAARTAMARHQRRFSRSCFRARTCSCVRLMAAAPRSSVNQGIWRHSCAPGRRRSSKLSAARTSCCAPGLAAWICSMGGPARWACRRPPTPKASPSVGTGAKG